MYNNQRNTTFENEIIGKKQVGEERLAKAQSEVIMMKEKFTIHPARIIDFS
jgi:hypothetical protein